DLDIVLYQVLFDVPQGVAVEGQVPGPVAVGEALVQHRPGVVLVFDVGHAREGDGRGQVAGAGQAIAVQQRVDAGADQDQDAQDRAPADALPLAALVPGRV